MTVFLRELRKTYEATAGTVTALDGVTVGFEQSTFTAIMGPSGSGKSTLLHCAAGLEQPTSGTVTVDGTVLGELGGNELTRFRRDRIGFVFQDFNLVSSLTAAQNVALPARLAGRRADAAAVTAVLDGVGLADRAAHRPSELSGGQQQRVAIARALFAQPAVVFADEPTGALDKATSHQILTLMRRMVDEHGRTIVLVTHDPVAAAVADRVLLLVDGRVTDEMAGADAAAVADRMTAMERSW
ncbi:ABC transporter ATP-binding protein [Paractinoplanes atraurantiacus]|uniref:Putative ABC transport system ATP-binding protein n=1 Tax=Paractinoplanes atraurantiacus TaxID=1036182 RepID=A0A285JLU1_9ACTN|nr:ABC transporter ATP-binding protein [Actinoplanes atraurantiacus]SNY61269.1 putative ABC transport system ATP-binding protein [Actinoplanes atraurantiacus]